MKITKNTPLKTVLKIGDNCEQCGHCCSYSSGFATEEDITKISLHLGVTENELKKKYFEEKTKFNTKMHRPKTKKEGKQYGPCVFLKNKKCSIHEVKPLQCRIGNCSEHGDALNQWFDLNFFVNVNDGKSIREYWGVLNARKPIEGGELKDLVKSKERLKKMLDGED